MRFNAAHTRFLAVLLPLGFVLVGCSSSNPIVSNYYDDGIYFDSDYGGNYMAEELGLADNGSTPDPATASPDGYDYYDPSYTESQNNSSWNSRTNMYYAAGYSPWAQPGFTFGIGMNMGYGYYSPWYSPYMSYYDPFSPYYGWGYNPYYRRSWCGNPWGPSYGWGPGYGWGYPNYGYPHYGYGYGYGYGYYPGVYDNTPNRRPASGTNGRTYSGVVPNRYASAPSGGRTVGGSGKTDFPGRTIGTTSRMNTPAGNDLSANNSSNRTPVQVVEGRSSRSRLRELDAPDREMVRNVERRTLSGSGRSSSRENIGRMPAGETQGLPSIQTTREPRRAQPIEQSRSRNNSSWSTPGSSRPSSRENRTYRPNRSLENNSSGGNRSYELNTRPSRTMERPSSGFEQRSAPSRSPSSSTPGRSSGNSSGRSSNTIRRR